MAEVVSVLHALVAAHDVEEVVLLEEAAGHVGAEHARVAAVVREAPVLLLGGGGGEENTVQLQGGSAIQKVGHTPVLQMSTL